MERTDTMTPPRPSHPSAWSPSPSSIPTNNSDDMNNNNNNNKNNNNSELSVSVSHYCSSLLHHIVSTCDSHANSILIQQQELQNSADKLTKQIDKLQCTSNSNSTDDNDNNDNRNRTGVLVEAENASRVAEDLVERISGNK